MLHIRKPNSVVSIFAWISDIRVEIRQVIDFSQEREPEENAVPPALEV